MSNREDFYWVDVTPPPDLSPKWRNVLYVDKEFAKTPPFEFSADLPEWVNMNATRNQAIENVKASVLKGRFKLVVVRSRQPEVLNFGHRIFLPSPLVEMMMESKRENPTIDGKLTLVHHTTPT